jgi:lipoic acid synthetase
MLLNIDSPRPGTLERPPAGGRLPRWFRVPAPGNGGYREIKGLVKDLGLHTVCESARCPNIGECWGHRTATFMILGDTCTRSCAFCAIPAGRPEPVDAGEPVRVAQAARQLGLRHAVVTSINRDDLPDGGAGAFAETIQEIHRLCPDTSVEVLVPDFLGDPEPLNRVLRARPQILNHNVETVPRLYRTMRPQALYDRSLELLRRSKDARPDIPTKSGIMVGAGETTEEVRGTIGDIADQGTDILTVGQYLRPSPRHAPVSRYYHPDEFEKLRRFAVDAGFRHVEAGPLVRSSYHAAGQVDSVLRHDS